MCAKGETGGHFVAATCLFGDGKGFARKYADADHFGYGNGRITFTQFYDLYSHFGAKLGLFFVPIDARLFRAAGLHFPCDYIVCIRSVR